MCLFRYYRVAAGRDSCNLRAWPHRVLFMQNATVNAPRVRRNIVIPGDATGQPERGKTDWLVGSRMACGIQAMTRHGPGRAIRKARRHFRDG